MGILKFGQNKVHFTVILFLGFFLNACTFEATKTKNNNSPAPEDSDSTESADKTAPDITNINLNDGINASDPSTSPSLSWSTAIDNESGLSHYEIALGTTSGGTEIQTWLNIGLVSSYQLTGLSLTPGQTYYLSLRAIDSAGNTSVAAQGDGFQVLSCNPALTNAFGAGDGSIGDPYRICSLNQWNHFADTTASWDKQIKLESDLDFTGIDYANFKTIGTVGNPFSGTFDGNNFTIKNITINAGSANFSIFLNSNNNVIIKNLTLKNFTLTSTGNLSSLIGTHESAGSITVQNINAENLTFNGSGAGLVDTSKSNVFFEDIDLKNIDFPASKGSGVIANILKNGSFNNIKIDGLSSNSSFDESIGGIVGLIVLDIADVANTFDISFNDISITNLEILGLNNYTGGLVGKSYQAKITIENTHVSGQLEGRTSGGFVGTSSPFFASNGSLEILNSSFNGKGGEGGGSNGGFIGLYQGTKLTIQNSFSKGNVEVWQTNGGGFVGQLTLTSTGSHISNSYSEAQMVDTTINAGVTGIGGLIGNGTAGSLTISNSYFAGTLSSLRKKGCLMGRSGLTLTISDSYFDSTKCVYNVIDSLPFSGATGLTTTDIQAANPFANWSALIWSFSIGFNPKQIWEL
ncbi:MAG TPA: fibronectin type III domain-containing protein [Pseudobdellovibrionaceae bacterium]|nr:fibronectin type III domain-containing protein [Pseudobdellovibrionaceae bacterium]